MDKVLNLSSFGEVIEDPKKDQITFDFFKRGKNRALDSDEPEEIYQEPVFSNISSIALKNLQHISQIKFFHWQTKSYAEHKALDSLFSELIELSDNLIESAMGKYGRPNSQGQMSSTHLLNYQEGCLTEYLDTLILCYSEECKKGLDPKSDSDLLNILDEMIALVNKTKYLITLK